MAHAVIGKSKISYRKPYLNPLLSLDQYQLARSTRQALKSKITRWLRLFRGQEPSAGKPYSPTKYDRPLARTVTLEQARLLALGSLGMEDKENNFMQLLFPDWCETGEPPPETPEKNDTENAGREKSGEQLTVDGIVPEPLEPAVNIWLT